MVTKCILTAILLISGGPENPDGTYRVEVEEYLQVDPIPSAYEACSDKWDARLPLLAEKYGARFAHGKFTIAKGDPLYVEGEQTQ